MKSLDQNHSKRNKITDLTKGNLGLFFGDFFGENFWGEFGWMGVKSGLTKSC
jgi:hypothetical protein